MTPDAKTDLVLSKVFPDVADRWKQARESLWNRLKRQIKATDGTRNFTAQWSLWGKGRLKEMNGVWVIVDEKQVVTHAMPGQSYHQYGLAVDSAFVGDDPYLEKLSKADSDVVWAYYGMAIKEAGLKWGGDWLGKKNDRPHAEKSYGFSTDILRITYEDFGIKGVWAKCKQSLLEGEA